MILLPATVCVVAGLRRSSWPRSEHYCRHGHGKGKQCATQGKLELSHVTPHQLNVELEYPLRFASIVALTGAASQLAVRSVSVLTGGLVARDIACRIPAC